MSFSLMRGVVRSVVREAGRVRPLNRGEAEALEQAIAQATAREARQTAARLRDQDALVAAIERAASAERAARLWRSTREARNVQQEPIDLAQAGIRVDVWGGAQAAPTVIRMPRQSEPVTTSAYREIAQAAVDFIMSAPGLSQARAVWRALPSAAEMEAVRRELDEAAMLEVGMDGVVSEAERPARVLEEWEQALAVRELLGRFAHGSATGPRVVPQPVPDLIVTPGESAWRFPPGWTVTWGPGFSTAEAIGGFPYVVFNSLLYGQYFGSGTGGGDLTNPASTINATMGVASGSNHTLWGPIVQFTPFDRRRQYRGNASEPTGWKAGDPIPEVITPDTLIQVVTAMEGLDGPSDLEALRDALRNFQLPGDDLLPRQAPGGGQLQVVHKFREAMGLRETARVVIGRERSYSVSQSTGEAVQVAPVRRPAEPHSFTRPGARVKEKKLLPRMAWSKPKNIFELQSRLMWLGGFGWNVFTESNDLVRSFWDALPRHLRTARMTESGNRRTDSMLKDLWNHFDRVDWAAATRNVIENQVEDWFYGRMSRMATKAGSRLRGGRGQGGLGTSNALSGTPWGG